MYIVVEMQTSKDGEVGTIVTKKENRNEADSLFYSALSAAAVSNVYIHSVVLLDAQGRLMLTGHYVHEEGV